MGFLTLLILWLFAVPGEDPLQVPGEVLSRYQAGVRQLSASGYYPQERYDELAGRLRANLTAEQLIPLLHDLTQLHYDHGAGDLYPDSVRVKL